MARRFLALLLAMALFGAACGGDEDASATTTDVPQTTTTAAATTTTSVATSTNAPATTTTAPETTTTVAEDATAGVDGAPTAALDRFASRTLIAFTAGELELSVETTGTRAGDSFDCRSDIALGGFTFTTRAVITPDGAWLDDGTGFREVSALDPDLANITSGCAADPAFWDGFSLKDFPPGLQGETEIVNGVAAQRLEIEELLDVATDLGFAPDIEGADFQQFTMWIAEWDPRWIAAMTMEALVDPELAAATFGELPFEVDEGVDATIVMEIEISQPDDPSLTVTTP